MNFGAKKLIRCRSYFYKQNLTLNFRGKNIFSDQNRFQEKLTLNSILSFFRIFNFWTHCDLSFDQCNSEPIFLYSKYKETLKIQFHKLINAYLNFSFIVAIHQKMEEFLVLVDLFSVKNGMDLLIVCHSSSSHALDPFLYIFVGITTGFF